MTLVDQDHRNSPTLDLQRLDDALASLVADEVISAEQAAAVTRAVAAPSPRSASPARSRLIEAAAYLGCVLVAAGVLALVAQSWDSLTSQAHVAVVTGMGAVAYVAGLVLALAFGGGRFTLRRHADSPRRRAVSVLLTMGALLVASSIPVSADASPRSFVLAAVVALLLVIPAELLAPSAASELALFGSSMMFVGQGLSLLVPERDWASETFVDYPPARAWDYLVPGALLVLGLAWAGLVSRMLTIPVLAQVLGLLVALECGIDLAANQSTRPIGLVVLAVLAVVGVLVFVRDRGWPWLVLTVLAATVGVFVLVSDAANPALAFLSSGIVLLVLAGGATLLGRRGARAEPLVKG